MLRIISFLLLLPNLLSGQNTKVLARDVIEVLANFRSDLILKNPNTFN